MHLVREYKSTYSNQISLEKYLILKVKEVEKENRMLCGKLSTADQKIRNINVSRNLQP